MENTMASADSFPPLGWKASHGKTTLFPLNPPDLRSCLRVDAGLPGALPGYPAGYALYPVPVRRFQLLL